MDYEADLDEWLTAGDEPLPTPGVEMDDGPPRSHIDADRILRRIRWAEREVRKLKELHKANSARLDAWLDDRVSGPERIIAESARELEVYARAEHERSGGRTKTWPLPNGTLRLTAARERLVVFNEAKAVAALDGVATKSAVDVQELKRLTKAMPVTDPSCICSETQESEKLRAVCPVHSEWELSRVVLSETGEQIPGVRYEKGRQPTFTQSPPKQ